MKSPRVKREVALAITALLSFGAAAAAQMTPISATGWNRDVVVENTGVSPYGSLAQPFDTFNNWSLYERNLPATTKGLPVGGTFNSVLDGTMVQLQPYDALNALFLDSFVPTDSLILDPADQIPYEMISVFASSSNGGGVGSLVITFTDTTTFGPINFNAQDWFFVTTNNALNNLGRMNLTTDIADDGSAGNPRIYQTNINLAALGLSSSAIASIEFTKPAGGGAQNTIVLALSGLPAITQMDPIEMTGFNRDVVVENSAIIPYNLFAQPFDVGGNFSWYEAFLPGSVKGLPAGGAFFSVSSPSINGQLAPYDQPNALFLNASSPTGTLTFAPADVRPYDLLAVFASSAGGGGLGSLVVHFSDTSFSMSIPFNAQDWFNVTTNNGLVDLGRMNLNTDIPDDGSANNPRLYQTIINLAGLGLNTSAVAAIEFTKPAASSSTVVMAVSGQSLAGPVGACTQPDGTCFLTIQANCTGTYQGDDTMCPPVGACIAANGDCVIRTQANCAFVGGSYQGDASACPAPGACIAANGDCTQLNSFQCAFQGGTFQGAGIPCPAPGACIAANGDCAQLNSFQCAFQGGTFQGVGAPCPTGGACCVGGSCVILNSLQCAFQGGEFAGEGSNCLAGAAIGTSSPALAITDNNTFTDFIIVSDTTPIDSLFLDLNINHTFIGDLTITLTFTPDVGPIVGPIDVINRVRRFSNTGFGSGSDLSSTDNYVFADGGDDLWAAIAATPVTVPHGLYSPSTNDGTATSPPNGAFTSFIPFAGLSPAGTWTITITDSAAGDVGTLNSWSVSRGACEQEPSGGACCMGAACVIVASAGDCTGINSSYAGDGTTCNAPGNNLTPCCRADHNQDGTISVPDIFAFLADWFAPSLRADFDSSGTVSVPDIFAFLSAWFAGGC